MYSSLLLCSILVLFGSISLVEALQISFYRQEQQIPILESSPTITNRMLLKDTALAHYESIVDDVLSEHNENLLTQLSTIIKDPHEIVSTLKPEAKHILASQTEISDVCVAQMPGIIANYIHELTNDIYSSIEGIISSHWKKSDIEYRRLVLDAVTSHLNKNDEQHVLTELMGSLEIINMEIADQLLFVVEQFDLFGKMSDALKSCQSLFSDTVDDQRQEEVKKEGKTAGFISKIWNAFLVSVTQSATMTSNRFDTRNNHGLLSKYILELRIDLQSELFSRVYELARNIYEDLAFSA
ncbi:hypothetical protein BDF20DRAFT_912637 [Mycotypha africana]|uniref:uncharacterized protein n=1 Tax=Mycotypha africana TaxID=64632 RepID=UPI002300070B|nr:uncharacterized protein BDF20DRAFT_912637 [Mycotypha africana]KAI8982483.1 hypothetical protein BDF20DRAFT_912637 [Mycotypha africana]